MKLCRLFIPGICLAWGAGTVFAESGTITGQGNWDAATTWENGTPVNGAGSEVTVKPDGDKKTVYLRNSVTVKSLVFSLEQTGSRKAFIDGRVQAVGEISGNIDEPTHWDARLGGVRFGVNTNTFAFNSGEAGVEARFENLRKMSASGGTGYNWLSVDVQDICLDSDLRCLAGGWTGNQNPEDYVNLILNGDVRERGGARKITMGRDPAEIEASGEANGRGALLLGCDNSFSGGLVVNEGIVRAGRDRALTTTDRTQFGTSEVRAESGYGRVDLNGNSLGKGQTLYLAGKPSGGGALFNALFEPKAHAEWFGDVVLTGPASIGGSSAINLNEPAGAVKVSGNISETQANCGIDVTTKLELTGDNTFTGPLALKSGAILELGRMESAGPGGIDFDGGAYHMKHADSPDLSEMPRIGGTAKANVMVGDFDWTPRAAQTYPKGMCVCAGGRTVRFANESVFGGEVFVRDGTVVFDYSGGAGPRFEPADQKGISAVRLANSATFELAGTGADYGTILTFSLQERSACTVRNATAHLMRLSGFDGWSWLSVLNWENGGRTRIWRYTRSWLADSGLWANSFCDGETWAYQEKDAADARYGIVSPWTQYTEDWDDADGVVDATAASLAALRARTAPVRSLLLRINEDAAAGADGEIVVAFPEGENVVRDGTILITKNVTKPVRLTGGSLTREVRNYGTGVDNALRIISYSAAPVTVECAVSGEIDLVTHVMDGGKVKLAGANTFTRKVVALRGGLEIDGAERLGWRSESEKNAMRYAKRLYLMNGAQLICKGEVNINRNIMGDDLAESFIYKFWDTEIYAGYSRQGAKIVLAEAGDSLKINIRDYWDNGAAIAVQKDSKLTIEGAGTFIGGAYGGDLGGWTDPNANVSPFAQRYGEVEFKGVQVVVENSGAAGGEDAGEPGAYWLFWEKSPLLVRLDGMTVKGYSALHTTARKKNNGLSQTDLNNTFIFEIAEGGATFDLFGRGASMGVGWHSWQYPGGMLRGGGTVRVVDTKSEAWANKKPFGAQSWGNRQFTGKLQVETELIGTFMAATSGLETPAGVTRSMASTKYPVCATHWGWLEGEGAINAPGNEGFDNCVVIGNDLGRDSESAGKLAAAKSYMGGSRFEKTGASTWRIAGAENDIRTSLTVKGGRVEMLHGSAGLGGGIVTLGGAKAKGRPEFLCAADFTNRIVVARNTPAGVVPGFGGYGAAAVAFTGPVVAKRDFALVAEEGEVTLRGAVAADAGVALHKRGAGRAVVEGAPAVTRFAVEDGELSLGGDVTVDGFAAAMNAVGKFGKLTTSGKVTVASGAALALDFDESSLDINARLPLLEAAGGIEGRFSWTGSLSRWRLAQNGRQISLVPVKGFRIFIR